VAAYAAQHRLSAGGRWRGDTNVLGVGEVQSDPLLKNARVNLALNAPRVADYSGGATHRVLFDFYGRNQVLGATEDLHFNASYRAASAASKAIDAGPLTVGALAALYSPAR
jgi:hypothetical protein